MASLSESIGGCTTERDKLRPLGTIRNELLQVAQQAVQPTHATIWIGGSQGR
jgi:hypothetical protein